MVGEYLVVMTSSPVVSSYAPEVVVVVLVLVEVKLSGKAWS